MKKLLICIISYSILSMLPSAFANSIKVNSGIKIPLKVEEKQSSKNLSSGSEINLYIASDIYQDEVLIFKRGDRAKLHVSESKKAGFLGHAGTFIINNGEIYDIKGTSHSLDFMQKYSGEEKTYPKVLLTVSIFFLFPLALFGFVKGGQGEISTDQIINVRLGESFIFKQ